MILVILGTQDKDFSRLLKAVDKEIENGTIKEKVIVQAGQTKYESKNMEIFDLISGPEFEKLIDEASLIITHGGVGSILAGIKKNKKIIAAARLSKYQEHHNDHQKQIIKEFADQGYLLELRDFNKLGKLIEKSKSFKQKKFESNTDNMIKIISDYIEDKNNISWYNKYKYYLIGFILNFICFCLINNNINISIKLFLASFIPYLLFMVFSKGNKKVLTNGIILIILDYLLFIILNLLISNIIITKILVLIILWIILIIYNKTFKNKGEKYE